jgi:hypothetical protein
MKYRILVVESGLIRRLDNNLFCSIRAAQKALGVKRTNLDMSLYIGNFAFIISRVL